MSSVEVEYVRQGCKNCCVRRAVIVRQAVCALLASLTLMPGLFNEAACFHPSRVHSCLLASPRSLAQVQKNNEAKAKIVYDAIADSKVRSDG